MCAWLWVGCWTKTDFSLHCLRYPTRILWLAVAKTVTGEHLNSILLQHLPYPSSSTIHSRRKIDRFPVLGLRSLIYHGRWTRDNSWSDLLWDYGVRRFDSLL